VAAFPAAVPNDGPPDPARVPVALPLEAHVVGWAVGYAPELMWRPFGRDGVTHVGGGAGLQPGYEYLFVPVDVGVRWRFAPVPYFQPWLGVGVPGQVFLIDDSGPFTRAAVTGEVGVGVGVGVGVTPSLAPLGVPGPGLAVRATLTVELGALAAR
jgi:hypothetical protein